MLTQVTPVPQPPLSTAHSSISSQVWLVDLTSVLTQVTPVPLLRHKAGQEGRGEILLENSFMR